MGIKLRVEEETGVPVDVQVLCLVVPRMRSSDGGHDPTGGNGFRHLVDDSETLHDIFSDICSDFSERWTPGAPILMIQTTKNEPHIVQLCNAGTAGATGELMTIACIH